MLVNYLIFIKAFFSSLHIFVNNIDIVFDSLHNIHAIGIARAETIDARSIEL